MKLDSLIVTHRISLRGADPAKLVASLSAKPGIQAVHAEKDGQHLAVTYDLLRVGLSDIEKTVDAAGATEPLGLIGKLHHGWLRFTEQNARDSVLAPVRDCCNKPPGGN